MPAYYDPTDTKPRSFAGLGAIVVGDLDTYDFEDGIGANDATRQVSIPRDLYLPATMSAEIEFESSPGNFQIDFQTADTDADEYYVTKASVTQTGLNASLVCRIEATNIVASFARLRVASLTNPVGWRAKLN